MKCNYVAIEREYGSGGSLIAARLAEEWGIPCYGREILEEVARKKKVSVDQIERYEEKATSSVLYTIYMMSCAHTGNSDMLSGEGRIYVEEQAVIREMAAKGPAIFLGHCAAEALKDKKGVLKVFIRSDARKKQGRIREQYGIAEDQIETERKRFDRKRSNYYHANTGLDWNDMKNYDIVLDSGTLGTEGCVTVLKGLR